MKTKKAGFIGGIPIEKDWYPIMFGAGAAKTVDELYRIAENPDAKIFEYGTITVDKRFVNPGNILHFDENNLFSLNSVGMNNSGIEKHPEELEKICKDLHSSGRKLIVSGAGINSIKELPQLIQLAINKKADGFVINAGCPNVMEKGKSHPPLSLDPEQLDIQLKYIQNILGKVISIPIWLKLSPLIKDYASVRTIKENSLADFILDMRLVNAIAAVIKKYKFIKAIICTNTIGNVCVLGNDGKPVLGPNSNNPNLTGGLAGKIIHKLSVAQAENFCEIFRPLEVDIIGAGGIEDGETLNNFLSVGCALGQITSAYLKKGDPGVLSLIAEEYFWEFSDEKEKMLYGV